jgi:hypothetical protein
MRVVLFFRIPVYLVIYDSGQVSLEHLLLSWYPPHPESITSPTTAAPFPTERGVQGYLAQKKQQLP